MTEIYFFSVWKLKSKIKVLTGLISPEASLLGLQMAAFSLCPQIVFFLCMGMPGVSSSSYKDTSSIGLGTHHMTLFYLIYLLKGPISKYSHIRSYRFNIWIWGGHNSVCNIVPFNSNLNVMFIVDYFLILTMRINSHSTLQNSMPRTHQFALSLDIAEIF